MKVVSVALAATYSAVLSLQGLDTNGPIGFSLSVGQTASDIFELYGTLDAAATDNTNAQLLGRFTGSTLNLPRGIADQARTWPFVLIRRVGGSTAGTLFVAGNPAASPAVVTAAAPVVSAGYSALLTLTTLGAKSVRIGGSRTMLVTDVFNVYLSDDPSLNSATGAFLAGTITGGGGTNFIAVDASGFNYAIVQRATTSTTLTAGNIIAAGVAPSEGGGVLNLTTLAVGDTAVNGPIGALSAAASVDIYSSFVLTQTTASITAATLPNPTITTAGHIALVMNNDTSTQAIQMYGMTIGIGASQWFSWDGTAWTGGRNITQGGNNFGVGMRIGTTDAFPLDIISGTDVTITPGAGGAVSLPPRAAGANNTTELRFLELAANGVNYAGFRAPDALAITNRYVLPSAFPTIDGQSLVSTAAGVMSWSGAINVIATNANAQTIADGAAAANVTTWTEVVDTAAAFDPAAGTFTVPAGGDGLYIVQAQLQYAATAADLAVTFDASIALGGVIQRSGRFVNPVAALAQTRAVSVTAALQLVAGNVISVQAALSANGGVDIALTNSAVFNYLSIAKVG